MVVRIPKGDSGGANSIERTGGSLRSEALYQ